MLTIENMTLIVGGRTLFENTGMTVGDNEKVALTGASGSGKSSLLKAIIGWYPIASGKITVGNVELNRAHLHDVRAEVAYIQQDPVICEPTVREVLLYPFTFHANRHRHKPGELELRKIVTQVNLPESILDSSSVSLSGGEKQRVSVARSLLVQKQFFLADEITSALDPDNRNRVVQLFMDLPQPMLAVVHDTELLSQHTRIYMIQNQKLVQVEASEVPK